MYECKIEYFFINEICIYIIIIINYYYNYIIIKFAIKMKKYIFITDLLQGEKFGRHTTQYSSLPRPPSSSKKGVVFGKVPSLISGAHTTVPLAIKGASARCLSAPTLGCD